MKMNEITVANYKQHVEEMIKQKIGIVVWGENATTLEEVLSFPQEYFCGEELSKELSEAICQYLLDSKFRLTIRNSRGKREYVWLMPSVPPTEPFISLVKLCTEDLNLTKKKQEERAKSEFSNFVNGSDRITVFKTENSFYREAIYREIARHPDYSVRKTTTNDWTYVVKYGKPHDVAWDNKNHVKYLQFEIDFFWSSLELYNRRRKHSGKMFFKGNQMLFKVTPSAKRFKFSVSTSTAEEFIAHMSGNGYKATLLPTYSIETYQEIGISPKSDIPVFVEVMSS